MRIDPNTLTVGNLFNINNEQFNIPAYQRRYAWGEKQLNDFFNDIDLLGAGDVHLLGTVVFLTDTHTPSIVRLQLIDGQQRITTLSILLKALYERLAPGDSDSAREIKKYLSSKGGSVSGDKLVLGDLDAEDYKLIMSGGKSEEIQNPNLRRTWEFFTQKVNAIEDPEAFYNKLVNSVEIIRLDISHAKDAYKLFETINNRGLRLSATDIVKNFLLGHASMLGEGTLEQVKKDWTGVIVSLDHIPGSTDRFLRHFLMGLLHEKIPASQLIEEFKNYYYTNIREATKLTDHSARLSTMRQRRQPDLEDEEEEDGSASVARPSYFVEELGILDFSARLKKAAETYAKILEANFGHDALDRRLRNLIRVESTPSYTFLLKLFQRDDISEKEVGNILFSVETFILRRQICEYRTAELDDIFSHLADMPSVGVEEFVRDSLKAHTPGNEEFREKFASFNHRRGDERAKYILARIEEHYHGSTNELSVLGGNDVHLEHIIPQTIKSGKAKKTFGDWIGYLGEGAEENHSRYVYRIGNLTLIAGTLNIRASNNPFASKLEAYEESAFTLNEHIRQQYQDFRYPQVEERSRALADVALAIWK
ncbi:hypothetical protein A2704_07075 [Candidatus Kaiserbacteria bacterium RIFCSPHIGHO2_01_FULL_54_36b]|uniref:DUF262 domain-containing protein n=1 Tax=Candidatus Kaiserbacteria bacterium RIFCSPHIGHO2_01_FULL_54_36b TaxID=1798483 RepID=A0A1F6CRE6_9BACT|nr:MAG: hypothetical protein A2704_07075 [Candidatus Kaiserbacteria bacterium RIFCSPHIGHO2_01_FULL_54_36b]